MALSSCPKCSNHLFEIQETEPSKSAYKLMFVQCSSCGAVVGVLDFFNIGAKLTKQDEALKRIAQKLGVHVDL